MDYGQFIMWNENLKYLTIWKGMTTLMTREKCLCYYLIIILYYYYLSSFVHCAMCIVHFALYIAHFALLLRFLHFETSIACCHLCIVHCALCMVTYYFIVHCVLCILSFEQYIVYCAMFIMHYALNSGRMPIGRKLLDFGNCFLTSDQFKSVFTDHSEQIRKNLHLLVQKWLHH